MIEKKETNATPLDKSQPLLNIDLDLLSKEAKSYLASLSMPSDKYIDLELKASGSTYIAPANGYFSYRARGMNMNMDVISEDNVVLLGNEIQPATPQTYNTVYVPVQKDQKMVLSYGASGSGGGVTDFLRFIYAQGEI